MVGKKQFEKVLLPGMRNLYEWALWMKVCAMLLYTQKPKQS